MHPVLRVALEPIAKQISDLTLEEAQVPPLPGHGRWCAQQIVEHLILTYQFTSTSLQQQLKTGRVPKNRRRALEFVLRVQTIGLGYMPNGVPSIKVFRPVEYTPEAGSVIAERFLHEAEEMDKLLVASRKRFGIEVCGRHPFFGALRVDEWRRYHAVHAVHHRPQLREAIRQARAASKA
jgi:hypothetical protein